MNRWRVGIPLSIFLFFMAFAANGQCVCTDCRCADSLELVKLYDSTNGNGWANKTNWKVAGKTIDTWYGVTLTNGRVTTISLSFNQLSGSIPNFNLPNLQYLYLYNNQLNGNIPNFNLPNLQYLNLNANQLSGGIPNFNLPNLQILSLYNNQLSRSIPNFNLPNLQYLYLDANQLSGSIPNFNLPNLQSLSLISNQLSGSIPNFNLPNLQYLNLDANQLSGSIPNFNLPNLQWLYLDINQLSGSIPNFNLPNLQSLSLYSNQLSGSIPNFNLSKLILLDIERNQLSGCIPKELKINCPLIGATSGGISGNSSLTTQSWANYWNNGEGACILQDTTTCRYKDSLQLVNLYNTNNGANWTNKTNWLSSRPLNEWYGIRTNTEGCVTFIDLDGNADFDASGSVGATGNKLSGQLPALTFSELQYLFLGNNQLSGALPAMNTPNIKNLDISYNPLIKGTIPPSWNFPNLEYLALCCNGLDGVLPPLSFPKLLGLYLQNNKLNGSLPPLNLPFIQQLDFGTNNFSNCFPAAYRALCPISSRNFFNNPLLPNNGDFASFCTNNTGICIDTTTCRYRDSLALVSLYNATGGANWTNKWDLSKPYSTWYGIQVDANGCVTCIDLDGRVDCYSWNSVISNNLNGTIPDKLNDLKSLKFISLGGGGIIGNIINFDMPTLEYIYITATGISGKLPNFNLPKLKVLFYRC